MLIKILNKLDQYYTAILSDPHADGESLKRFVKKLTGIDNIESNILINHLQKESNKELIEKMNFLIQSLNDKEYNLYIQKTNLFKILEYLSDSNE